MYWDICVQQMFNLYQIQKKWVICTEIKDHIFIYDWELCVISGWNLWSLSLHFIFLNLLLFFESEKWHVDCVTDFHMLLPPFCGIHFLCYHYKFGFWRAQRTYIIISFVSVCFHFECVDWCMKLPFCSYSSTYSVDFFFSFFNFL